jgi:Ribbon-helix-helix protein, copG family
MPAKRMLTVSFECEAEARDKLCALAEADARRSMASVIRCAVHEYLDKHWPDHTQSRNRSAA